MSYYMKYYIENYVNDYMGRKRLVRTFSRPKIDVKQECLADVAACIRMAAKKREVGVCMKF